MYTIIFIYTLVYTMIFIYTLVYTIIFIYTLVYSVYHNILYIPSEAARADSRGGEAGAVAPTGT